MLICGGIAIAVLRMQEMQFAAAGVLILLYAGLIIALERSVPPHA